jgi:APA family basic amino acid/polyamine antiporter
MSGDPRALRAPELVAAGCGTAIASVCAFGLFQIERLVGGVWSALAVALAGLLCAGIAQAFARLAEVVPSGAGIIAYLSRGLGRRAGVLIAAPYLLLTLFLVGAEATIVGVLSARIAPLPPFASALAFLVGTFALCRAGLRVSHRAQAIATWALIASLGGLSIATIAREAVHGGLLHRLAPPAPTPGAFVTAVGQALFLFMGFELITSQAEVAAPRAIARGLRASVAVLTVFYAVVSLGFSSMGGAPPGAGSALIPQIGMAEAAGGPLAVAVIAVLSLLASFTSFNGALLALSRFTAALASQGVLPRRLGKTTARGLVPAEALSALLVCSILFTAIIGFGGLLSPAILAAAASAALVYAGALWVRQRPPFSPPGRPWSRALPGYALAIGLALVGVGVVADAGKERIATLAILGAAFAAAAAASYRGFGAVQRRGGAERLRGADSRLAPAEGGSHGR